MSHSCGDSRLTCTDCSSQICPSCFVQCAVGNRCKKCASRFTSHVLQVSKAVIAKASAAAAAAGFAFGYVLQNLGTCGWMPLILSFGAGVVCGRVTHKVASYKLGKALAICVFICSLSGFMFSPIGSILLTYALSTLQIGASDEAAVASACSFSSRLLLALGLFLTGLMMPFLKRS